MRTSRTIRALTTSAALALALGGFAASPAFADGTPHGGHILLNARLVGSMPAPDSPAVAGINPGAAPWVNGPSRVRVRDNGNITVQIRGLVIPPPRGTGVNPIASVVATLVCDQQVAASTTPFALSTAGDGSTHDVIAVPRHCDDPVVLIQPAANRAVYIASTTADKRSHAEHDD
ncbi:hypothetical protein DDP54_02185 [Cellulomonas sp. WB94]|uniref:hypothetical protein n=1 Tax=Cellulomonas sp. WB94 TaxID=2173174 RepID=UPI000D566B7A|nr:hypothetical protein [Cellulomonas sp. WB94]PVU82015.1 hypothetical protein DDP54_02185 [Cellulomonas sp. WB94]